MVLLVIALMWNFSLFIPKDRLRNIMLTYLIISIAINFSAPVIKLGIDGSNMLQNVFLHTTDNDGEIRKITASDFFDYGEMEYNAITGYSLENSTAVYTEIKSSGSYDTLMPIDLEITGDAVTTDNT